MKKKSRLKWIICFQTAWGNSLNTLWRRIITFAALQMLLVGDDVVGLA